MEDKAHQLWRVCAKVLLRYSLETNNEDVRALVTTCDFFFLYEHKNPDSFMGSSWNTVEEILQSIADQAKGKVQTLADDLPSDSEESIPDVFGILHSTSDLSKISPMTLTNLFYVICKTENVTNENLRLILHQIKLALTEYFTASEAVSAAGEVRYMYERKPASQDE